MTYYKWNLGLPNGRELTKTGAESGSDRGRELTRTPAESRSDRGRELTRTPAEPSLLEAAN